MGSTMVKKMRSSFAPSIRAESISACGISRKNCICTNTRNGDTASGRITAHQVLRNCSTCVTRM